MVNVARSKETGVDRRWGAGVWRGVLVCTVAMRRACVRAFVTCPRTAADRRVEGLTYCESIVDLILYEDRRDDMTSVGKVDQFTEAFHRWSVGGVSLAPRTRRLSGDNIPEM